MKRKDGICLALRWVTLVLVPLVVVIPIFHHFCTTCHEENRVAHCCGDAPSAADSWCVASGGEAVCQGCKTEIKRFSFIGNALIPPTIDMQPLSVIEAMMDSFICFRFSYNEAELDCVELRLPPLLCFNRSLQRLFCVLIC